MPSSAVRTVYLVYPQTGAVCGYLRKLAPGAKNGWRQFRPGGAVGHPSQGAVLAVTACVEAETDLVDSTEAVLVVWSLLDRSGEGFASFARMWAPMMGLCPSPAGREPLSFFERFLALVYFTYEGK
ncbi:hypothetical protein EVAR_42932_1 [Eumeta japonica]|uniref:Uncharacterized protein n=1 Tax=Eumeta variegata TaxID=151549 RepID=A0A4C1WVS2_EUMVA|nr:hypothetical protein EVAR_42932_1 [Eumeta japonica]